MALDFASIASKPVSEIEKPPLPPVAHYNWAITKLPEQRTTADGAWDVVDFQLRCVGVCDDFEPDDYKGDPTKITQRLSFMFDKNDEAKFDQTLWGLKKFLIQHCKVGDEEMTVGQLLNESVNAQFMANIVWKQDRNDNEVMHANIGKTAPLE